MYVPVMKNRTVEVSVLRQLSMMGVFDNTVIPMIELVQERTRSNMKNSFLTELADILENAPHMSVLVDFYKSSKLRNTSDAIREYITRIIRQPDFCYEELVVLEQFSDQVIPVISYMSEDISITRILADKDYFQKKFQRVAFRLKPQEFDSIFEQLLPHIRQEDFVIFDIDTASCTSPVFKPIYKTISDHKKKIGYTSIAIKAHRPENLANNKMIDKEPIAEIDNALKDLYSTSYMSRFNGFGDYATISAALPTTGGAISPVGIYYSQENNFFVAFKGRKPLLSEFPEYIAPSIVASEYWEEFDQEHHEKCPGCYEISQILSGEKSGKNQAQWKMIAMLHYIYTMYEMDA